MEIDQVQHREKNNNGRNGDQGIHDAPSSVNWRFRDMRLTSICPLGERAKLYGMKKVSRLRTRLFQGWFRLKRPMTLGVRGLVADSRGHIVLVRHTYTEGWYLPGGGVEKDETAHCALRRELAEEAGVALTRPAKLRGIFSNHHNFPNDHVLLYTVDMSGWKACDTDCAGEIEDICWVDPACPPDGTTPATRRRLDEWLAGAPPSMSW